MAPRPGLVQSCCCCVARVCGAWAEQGCGLLAESLESYRIAQGIEPQSEIISRALAVVLTDLGEPREHCLRPSFPCTVCMWAPSVRAWYLQDHGSYRSASLTECAVHC